MFHVNENMPLSLTFTIHVVVLSTEYFIWDLCRKHFLHVCVLQYVLYKLLKCLSNIASLKEHTAMASDDRPSGTSKQVGKEHGKGEQPTRYQAERR